MPALPLVSVVIPCLNRAEYLAPTIESVLQQDYSPIECIVVDGGSSDGTIEILRSYGKRIQWVSEPDKGPADAINKGWQTSSGEILAWLNADDVWVVPDAASQAVAYLETHPGVDVVYGDCGAIDAEGNLIGMSYLHEWDLEYAIRTCDHCIPQPAAFVRSRILQEVGWLDPNLILMDRDLWYRIGLTGTIRHVPVLLAHARRHRSFWHSRSHIVAANCVQIIRKFFDNPDLPSNFRRMKRRAISNAHLRGMDYAWTGRHWRTIFTYPLRATLVDPTNALSAFRRLSRYLVLRAAEEGYPKWVLTGLRLLSCGHKALRKIMRSIRNPAHPRTPNLLGDRDIEWSWITSQMPSGPGKALDFGSGRSHLALVAAQRGFDTTAVDLGSVDWPYAHPRLRFIQGDILRLPLPKEHYDLVTNCSTVEHVGLPGRYGVQENNPNGDLEAMAHLRDLMKPGGVMLLTVPAGQDGVFAPLTRVYGPERLPLLLDGYVVEREVFWIKDDQNRWVLCDREDALSFEGSAGSWDPLQNAYALGAFVLRKPD